MSRQKLFKAFFLFSITLLGTATIIAILFFSYLLSARSQPTTPADSPVAKRPESITAIPGITTQDIINALSQNNVPCNTYETFNEDFLRLTCEQKTSSARFLISIFTTDKISVHLIDANYTQFQNPSDQQAVLHLGELARLPYKNGEAEQAYTWVAKTMPKLSGEPDDIKTTTINGVKLKLYGRPEDRSLEIGEIP
ncbi:MAG: hypothetical protein HPY45_08170 [Anaerolineae bacterium]|nr:hypothetical protein [Anaerolineae bacterium]